MRGAMTMAFFLFQKVDFSKLRINDDFGEKMFSLANENIISQGISKSLPFETPINAEVLFLYRINFTCWVKDRKYRKYCNYAAQSAVNNCWMNNSSLNMESCGCYERNLEPVGRKS